MTIVEDQVMDVTAATTTITTVTEVQQPDVLITDLLTLSDHHPAETMSGRKTYRQPFLHGYQR